MHRQGRLSGRKVVFLVADQTHDEELNFPKYWLQWEHADVLLAGLSREHTSRFGRPIRAEITTSQLSEHRDAAAVVIPGGFGPDRLRTDSSTLDFVRRMDHEGKPIASICHGAQVLISAQVVRGRRLTCVKQVAVDVMNAGGKYVDEAVVQDGNLITSRLPPDLPGFTEALIEALLPRKLTAVARRNRRA
jgi:protease I